MNDIRITEIKKGSYRVTSLTESAKKKGYFGTKVISKNESDFKTYTDTVNQYGLTFEFVPYSEFR